MPALFGTTEYFLHLQFVMWGRAFHHVSSLWVPFVLIWALSCNRGSSTHGPLNSSSGGADSVGRGDDEGPSIDLEPGGGEQDDTENECEREVSLQPVVLGQPEPFDLVIVADNSDSLAWSREDLARGLEDLLVHVQGQSVRIFVLTPTQYGESSAQAVYPPSGESLVKWQDPATGMAYFPEATTYSQTCTDELGASISCSELDGTVPGALVGTWDFTMPEPIAAISPESTQQDFESQQMAVASAILETSGIGAPEERPLCTLARYVNQAPQRLPENIVFLVITDEDDTSLPGHCMTKVQNKWFREQIPVEVPCASNCDHYYIVGERGVRRKHFEFSCVETTDTGAPIPGTEVNNESTSPDVYEEECEELMHGPCDEEERADRQKACGTGLGVVSCVSHCVEAVQRCDLRIDGHEVQTCSQPFRGSGESGLSFSDYCSGRGIPGVEDCTLRGVNIDAEGQSVINLDPTGTEDVAGASGIRDLGKYFRSRADEVFGDGKYQVEGIVHMPEFSCELGPGQSHATQLAKMIGDPARLFPLCESYAPALQDVVDFAQDLIQSQFALPLEDNEGITAVTMVDLHGDERSLSSDQFRFDAETQTLHIERSAVLGTDRDMRVEVTAGCEPVVR